MSELDFQSLQRRFAAHVRDPASNPPPDQIEDRRLAIYRELVFNNIESFLRQGFPVASELLEHNLWLDVVRNFLADFRCESPYFLDIPREFLTFISSWPDVLERCPPFLPELAHYEWVELDLEVSTRKPGNVALDPQGDLLEWVPVWSPLFHCLRYEWPVHMISCEYRPGSPSPRPHHLLVYRDGNDDVGFMEINAMTAMLVDRAASAQGQTGRALLQRLALDCGLDANQTIRYGEQLLYQLLDRGVVLGAAPVVHSDRFF